MKFSAYGRWVVTGLAALGVSLVGPSAGAMAQSAGCPIAGDGTVSQAVGSPMSGSVDAVSGPLTLCTFADGSGSGRNFGVSRETGAFGPSDGGVAGLAQRYIPGLPDDARAQIAALNQAGINIAVPDYELTAVTGVGDSALWVKTQLVPGVFRDSLLVQRGGDGFSFDADDAPDAQASLTALAQAVLSQPAQ